MSADSLLRGLRQAINAEGSPRRVRTYLLDLAVRGLLTQQLPSDEPAPAVLERLAAAPRSLKASKGREAVFRPVSVLEQAFELPSNWAWTRIRAITNDRGQTTPQSDFTYIDVTAIEKESGRLKSLTVLSPHDAPSRARRIVSKGDVLYSCVRPNLLNVAIIEDELSPPAIASTAFAVLNCGGHLVPRYLWAVLRSPYFTACVEGKMRGQAYPAINEGDFAVLPVPLPPLEEQHRIVAELDHLMALCDELEDAQIQREARRDHLRTASLRNLVAPDESGESARFFISALTIDGHQTGTRCQCPSRHLGSCSSGAAGAAGSSRGKRYRVASLQRCEPHRRSPRGSTRRLRRSGAVSGGAPLGSSRNMGVEGAG